MLYRERVLRTTGHRLRWYGALTKSKHRVWLVPIGFNPHERKADRKGVGWQVQGSYRLADARGNGDDGS